MTAYARGNAAERRVKAHLEADGYLTLQSRGSKGYADLVALKPGQTLAVQVKSGAQTTDGGYGLTHESWNGLLDLAARAGAVPLVAVPRYRRRGVDYWRLTGAHVARSRLWPAEPWTADVVLVDSGVTG